MADRVVSVSFERDARILPLHPLVERIVKKEIRQHGTDDSPLRGPSFPVNQGPVRHAHRRPQPPFQVEQNPWAVRVPPHGSHQEVPIDLIEETLDVQIEHPVISPATLPSLDEGIMRRLPWPISIGIPVETPVPGSAPGAA